MNFSDYTDWLRVVGSSFLLFAFFVGLGDFILLKEERSTRQRVISTLCYSLLFVSVLGLVAVIWTCGREPSKPPTIEQPTKP